MKSEKKTYVDRASGVEVTQLTDYKGHSHHFYLTNPGWYAEGHKLLFASDRNNRTNLFGADLESGEIEQLTNLDPVPLPREVEFLRASKNPVREEVCFWHDLTLLCLDIGAEFSIPYFPHVSVGWDNNPRVQNFRPGVVKKNTPEQIQKALELARDYADRHPAQPQLITINSWNEWTETSYLQPDDLYGYGYLEAVRNVFGACDRPGTVSKEKI